jgi:hypothetical protein
MRTKISVVFLGPNHVTDQGMMKTLIRRAGNEYENRTEDSQLSLQFPTKRSSFIFSDSKFKTSD